MEYQRMTTETFHFYADEVKTINVPTKDRQLEVHCIGQGVAVICRLREQPLPATYRLRYRDTNGKEMYSHVSGFGALYLHFATGGVLEWAGENGEWRDVLRFWPDTPSFTISPIEAGEKERSS